MTEQKQSTSERAPATTHPLIGIAAVLLGGLLSTLNGRLLSVALPSLRGALHLSVDEGVWIPTSYNMAIMFLCVYFGVPRTPLPRTQGPGPSWRGLLYWSFGLALIYGALDQGERVRWFGSSTFVAMLTTGLFLVLISILRRRRKRPGITM